MSKILVVAAHPDDEVLGCGGSIIRHAMCGDAVHVMIMAEGLTSRDIERNIDFRKDELKVLHNNTYKAAELMGVENVTFCNFPDNRMDKIDLLDIIKEVEKKINQFKPEIVYTHNGNDLNIDHVITQAAVITACRVFPGQFVKRILFFETVSSTEWQIQTTGKVFLPNWYVDIKSTFEKKIEALKCYETEMREYPHPRSYQAIKNLAMYRGNIIGKEFAEAFMLGRNVC